MTETCYAATIRQAVMRVHFRRACTKPGLYLANSPSARCVTSYFRRDKALFSDSSDSEKNDAGFRNAMTFKDPDGQELICFWHGKVRRPIQFRIHFSYPIQSHTPLYIAYIGPKLTKK